MNQRPWWSFAIIVLGTAIWVRNGLDFRHVVFGIVRKGELSEIQLLELEVADEISPNVVHNFEFDEMRLSASGWPTTDRMSDDRDPNRLW